jgi:hypothetical protein
VRRKRPLDEDLVWAGILRAREWLEEQRRSGRKPTFEQDDFHPTRETARTLVGRGWWPLLDEAFDVAEATGIPLLQIKEKFGALRLVPTPGMDSGRFQQAAGQLREIAGRSLTTCEACGAPGRKRDDFFWMKTLCDGCSALRAAGRSWAEIFGFQPYTTPMS